MNVVGLLEHASSMDLVKIVALACFCAIRNHGFDMFFSFSEIVQHTPFLPIGWSILKAGLKKSVLSSVYSSTFKDSGSHNSSHGMTASKP